MDLGATELLIGISGGSWAAFNVLATAQRQINSMRDVMLLGKIGNEPIDFNFRWHMLYNDWIPAWALTSFLSMVFGATIASLPMMVTSSQGGYIWAVCILLSLVPLGASVLWIISGWSDMRFIKREIEKAERLTRHSNQDFAG